MSDRLWQLLAQHTDLNAMCARLCSCGIQHPIGYVYHLTEVITAEFLAVPRSDILGTEYAVERQSDRHGLRRYRADDEADALAQAERRQVDWARTWPVSRPILAWTPLHETGEADA